MFGRKKKCPNCGKKWEETWESGLCEVCTLDVMQSNLEKLKDD